MGGLVHLSDGFALLILFGAIALVGGLAVIARFSEKDGLRPFLVSLAIFVVGILGCGYALSLR